MTLTLGCLSPLDSPGTLESSLSPAELVPFEGCVIPPLTPQRSISEDSLVHSSAEAGDLWRDIAQCQDRMLGDSVEVNNQVIVRFLDRNPLCM